MDAIHVRRVQMRCRVQSGRELDRERAQRIFRDDLASALEDAVAAAGIGEEEQVCIRTLQLSARLWMGLTDDALRREWAELLAAQIRRAIAGGDVSQVVRYVSENAAVLDALRSLSRADVTRLWAWRQLGFATTIAPGGRRADTICELLLSRPQSIVPALRALADEPSFWRLLASLDDDQLVAIADAALEASGIHLRLAAIVAHDAIAPIRGGRAASVAQRARAVAQRARAVRVLDAQASQARSVAIAVLAALEAEPSLLRGNTDRVCVTIAELLDCIGGGRTLVARRAAQIQRKPEQTDDTEPSKDAPLENLATHTADSAGRESDAPANALPPSVVAAPAAGPTTPVRDVRQDPTVHALSLDAGRRLRVDAAELDAADAAAGDGVFAGDGARSSDVDAPETPESVDGGAPRDERERAHSDWAGLLFLINVLRDSASIDPLLDDAALAARPVAWVLHRLALLLVPAEPTDAAVLVFAGLRPGQLPAEFADDPPTADEQSALLRHARACVERTCERLGTDASEAVLYTVCARGGEVVADPGWIAVRFPIDAVDLDVRRAGLDLNPDYVPWLGIVLRFAYV